ncbi:MAG: ATP-dependent Clp protease adapter ClpS [Myxococcota bacterium]
MAQHDDQGDVAVEKKKKEKTKEPPQYKVLFHNDNYTTMEFVVRALETIFNKSPAEAAQVMLHVHNTGSGVAGVYSRDVAETKVHQTRKWAREEGHPLMVTMEPE